MTRVSRLHALYSTGVRAGYRASLMDAFELIGAIQLCLNFVEWDR